MESKHSKIVKSYAEALLEVGVELGRVDEFYNELYAFYELIEEDETFRRFWLYPAISKEEKKGVIVDIFKDKLSLYILNFLKLVIDKGREPLVRYIVRVYKELVDEYHNRMEVVVETPFELTEEQKSYIVRVLSEKYDKEIVLRERIKPELIGGIRLKIGFKEIDDSIITRLNKIRQELLMEGV